MNRLEALVEVGEVVRKRSGTSILPQADERCVRLASLRFWGCKNLVQPSNSVRCRTRNDINSSF